MKCLGMLLILLALGCVVPVERNVDAPHSQEAANEMERIDWLYHCWKPYLRGQPSSLPGGEKCQWWDSSTDFSIVRACKASPEVGFCRVYREEHLLKE